MSSVLASSAERLLWRSHSSQRRVLTWCQVGVRAKMTLSSMYMPRVVSGEAQMRVRRGEVYRADKTGERVEALGGANWLVTKRPHLAVEGKRDV